MTLLLVKLPVSIAVVLGLAWIAEHVHPRIAGIISGMPLGALLVLLFVGLELGPAFAAESARHGVPSLLATIAFALGYYFGSHYGGSHYGGRLSALSATAAGLPCYFAVAAALNAVALEMPLAIALSLAALSAMAYAVRTGEANRIETRARMTLPRLLFRAGTASGMVLAITAISEAVGPQWSGLLLGFPMTFLPFLLVIHLTYSAEHVRTIIRNFPLGLAGLLIFLVVATFTLPSLAVPLAIALSLAGALAYLSLLGVVLTRLRSVATAEAE